MYTEPANKERCTKTALIIRFTRKRNKLFFCFWHTISKRNGGVYTMDRVFVFDEKELKDKFTNDWRIYHDTLRASVSAMCDKIYTTDGSDMPDIRKFISSGKRVVPVGSLDFVRRMMSDIKGGPFEMRPIEIPDPLRPFVVRPYNIVKGKEISKEQIIRGWFIKDADCLKSWTNLLMPARPQDIAPEKHYVVSKYVHFLSEWRIFVDTGEIIACCNYLGDPVIFPDEGTLRKMVGTYTASGQCPRAYTLDIGVRGNITEPIEVHSFVSCGLYGAADLIDKRMGDMLDNGIKFYEKKDKT